MLSLEGNTAPYLQYAYARIRSIFRKAPTALDVSIPALLKGELVLTDPAELALAKQVLRFGEALETVARELKPHHLCNYVYELAGKFSTFYAACDVLGAADEATRTSRLLLVEATARTLKDGLGLLGIECPEQM
jgi:arginyl-tRNA synthetase